MKYIRFWLVLLGALISTPASSDSDSQTGYECREDRCWPQERAGDNDDRDHEHRNGHYRPRRDSERDGPLARPNPMVRPAAQGWNPPK